MAIHTSATINGRTYNRGDAFTVANTVTAYGSSDGGNGSQTIAAGTTMYFYSYADYNYSTYPYYILPSASYQDTQGWVGASAFPSITIPSISNVTVSSIGRTSASASFSVTNNGGAGIVDNYIDVFTDYACTNKVGVITGTSGTFTGLTPNTTYYVRANASNGTYRGYSSVGSFTTTGNVPTISSATPYPARLECYIGVTVSYDTNASYSAIEIQYGTTTSYGTTITTGNITGLSPNTTYYYRVRVKDNWNRWSSYKTGSFKTSCNAPTNVGMSRISSTTDSVTVAVSADGDINAPITNYTLYYKKSGTSTYTSVYMGTSVTWTVSSLDADTNYVFQVLATNAGGDGTSNEYTYSTLLTNPTISSFTISNLTPFTATLNVSASISPLRTLRYSYSLDGNTWSSYTSSTSYNLTGLSEETTYTPQVKVRATHAGNSSADTYANTSVTFTTPADQAKIYIKKDGSWVKGKTYIRVNGQWKKAKKLYIKKNGNWVINNNGN